MSEDKCLIMIIIEGSLMSEHCFINNTDKVRRLTFSEP